VKAAKQWASPYWAPSCAKISFAAAPEEEQREFARTPAEADLASASDQNTACGLHAEALPVRSRIHKDYNGKVA
jgi:hypothetical protein